MTVIWKYYLDREETTLGMPPSAEVLDVQAQRGRAVLWARIDWESGTVPEEREARTFVIRRTGQGFTDTRHPVTYIGTVQVSETLVYHVFEVTP